MGSQVNDNVFAPHQFRAFPYLKLTRYAWLIGSYDHLRGFVTKMKEDEAARKQFLSDLREWKGSLKSLPGDDGVVLLRFGRRESDKIYDLESARLDMHERAGSSGATKIQSKLSTEQHAAAIDAQGKNYTAIRNNPVTSEFDKNLKARITDIDGSGDYAKHWGDRQFEAHHIVEDSLGAMKEAKSRFSGLTRGSSPCVLLTAELHQRFYTSALAQKRYLTVEGNLSERDRLNSHTTKTQFQNAYNQLYSDPCFADIRAIAMALIESLFSSGAKLPAGSGIGA